MKKKVLIASLVAVVAGLAVAGSLYYWNEQKDNEKQKDIDGNKTTEWSNAGGVDGGYTSYVDLKSIHLEGKYVSVIVLFDYKNVRGNLKYFSAKKNLLFNCETTTGFLKAWDKSYTEPMGSGELIRYDNVEDIQLKEPEVLFPRDRQILEIACKISKNNTDKTNKPLAPVNVKATP